MVEDLLALRTRFDANPVLLLTQEASVATISASRDILESIYHFTLPSHSLLVNLLDKLCFQALAEQAGFPIPRAVRVKEPLGVAVASQLRFPCVLKPTTKNEQYGKHFVKAYKVTNYAEAELLWSRMRHVVEEIVIQEWVEAAIPMSIFVYNIPAKATPYHYHSLGEKFVNGHHLLVAQRAAYPHQKWQMN